jgi:hypothetical protein
MRRGLLLQRQLASRGQLSHGRPRASVTYAVLATLSGGCPPLKGRLPTCYSPVRRFTRGPKSPFSLDLHVLSPPLTFALSQDQTLHLMLFDLSRRGGRSREPHATGVLFGFILDRASGDSSHPEIPSTRSSLVAFRYSVFRDRPNRLPPGGDGVVCMINDSLRQGQKTNATSRPSLGVSKKASCRLDGESSTTSAKEEKPRLQFFLSRLRPGARHRNHRNFRYIHVHSSPGSPE